MFTTAYTTIKFIAFGIAVLMLICAKLFSSIVELGHPFEMEVLIEANMELDREAEDDKALEAKERIENGEASSDDHQRYSEYLDRHFANEGSSSGNDGGTFSMETNFADRERDS